MSILLSNMVMKVIASKRLLIEYAMIAVIISTAAGGIWLWLQKNSTEKALLANQVELVTVKGRLSTVETINDSQQQHILQLKSLRLRDAQAISGLLTDYQNLSTKDSTVRSRLQSLEKSNEAVRDYLHQPIPADLMCMLNETCSPDPDSGKVSSGKATSRISKSLSTS